eukprot:TRINITY_DN50176_c0_g1_i1.p1 TRINITY_DN50176_c0_g1~~TRINITY_DN50176_c0_g1_i1.p1  ORF type:complete len:734 (-),score=151.78 TRINITY_DN50176_c0_g1_i1:149-2074(-)
MMAAPSAHSPGPNPHQATGDGRHGGGPGARGRQSTAYGVNAVAARRSVGNSTGGSPGANTHTHSQSMYGQGTRPTIQGISTPGSSEVEARSRRMSREPLPPQHAARVQEAAAAAAAAAASAASRPSPLLRAALPVTAMPPSTAATAAAAAAAAGAAAASAAASAGSITSNSVGALSVPSALSPLTTSASTMGCTSPKNNNGGTLASVGALSPPLLPQPRTGGSSAGVGDSDAPQAASQDDASQEAPVAAAIGVDEACRHHLGETRPQQDVRNDPHEGHRRPVAADAAAEAIAAENMELTRRLEACESALNRERARSLRLEAELADLAAQSAAEASATASEAQQGSAELQQKFLAAQEEVAKLKDCVADLQRTNQQSETRSKSLEEELQTAWKRCAAQAQEHMGLLQAELAAFQAKEVQATAINTNGNVNSSSEVMRLRMELAMRDRELLKAASMRRQTAVQQEHAVAALRGKLAELEAFVAATPSVSSRASSPHRSEHSDRGGGQAWAPTPSVERGVQTEQLRDAPVPVRGRLSAASPTGAPVPTVRAARPSQRVLSGIGVPRLTVGWTAEGSKVGGTASAIGWPTSNGACTAANVGGSHAAAAPVTVPVIVPTNGGSGAAMPAAAAATTTPQPLVVTGGN